MQYHFRYNEKVSQEFGSENQELLKVAKMVEEWISKFLLCLDPAESWEQIASGSLDAYKHCDGDPLVNWKSNGFSSFFDVLMVRV